jgi:hypothetical protein
MRLDRNEKGRNKYAIVPLRRLEDRSLGPKEQALAEACIQVLQSLKLISFGDGSSDFFVIKLRDRYAHHALRAYGNAAMESDKQYASEVLALADEAAGLLNSGQSKIPD